MKHISDKEKRYYLKTVVIDSVLFICLFTQQSRMSHPKYYNLARCHTIVSWINKPHRRNKLKSLQHIKFPKHYFLTVLSGRKI